MPRKKGQGAVASIQRQLTEAANSFAREILGVLRAATLSDLTALAGRAPVAQAAPSAAGEEPGRRRPSPRTSALRRIAGTKPVGCPVVGCANPGVRSKMNFCNDHAAALSQPEKLKLRAQQKARHVAESISLPAADKGKKRKAKTKRKGA